MRAADGRTSSAVSRCLTGPLCPPENLQGLLDAAEGPDALPDERKELEELKALLPEIQEKVEDAAEGLKTASSAAEAVKEVLVGLMF